MFIDWNGSTLIARNFSLPKRQLESTIRRKIQFTENKANPNKQFTEKQRFYRIDCFLHCISLFNSFLKWTFVVQQVLAYYT